MTEIELDKILLAKNASVKEFPFDKVTAVYKVMNKIFALVGHKEGYININLKCLPDDALGYRDIYECVIPGYHMNKKHWNTIIINESYDLIVAKLTKKEKSELAIKN